MFSPFDQSMAQRSPSNQSAIDRILNQNPKSKIIFQQDFSPSVIRKGIINAPLIMWISVLVPFSFVAYISYRIYKQMTYFSLYNSPIEKLVFIFPLGFILIVSFLFVGTRFILQKSFGANYSYVIVETPEEFLLVNVRNGRANAKTIIKSEIKKFMLREVQKPSFSSFSNLQQNDIYTQLLVEHGSEYPQIDIMAQSNSFNSTLILSLKRYLETNGYIFESNRDFSEKPGNKICKSCNYANSPEAEFCENCGINLRK